MVTDQEIASCVESLLRAAPPGSAASVSGVVRQLEAKLGIDLSHKAAFIRDQIDLLLGPPKDNFVLHPHPHPQFHPAPHFQIPQPTTTSPFTHFPRQHELAFRYPAPPLPATTAAAGALAVQHQLQLQQMVPPRPAVVTRAEVAAPVVASAPRPAAAPAAAASTPKESAPTGVKRRGGPGGLSKVCGVSPELQAIVGEPTMARTQIVKQLWAYIRKNNLQDPNNKRKIICNDELRLVFETDCTDMFKMNKLLAKHIIPLEQSKDTGPDSKRLKAEAAEVVSEAQPNTSECSVVISDALAKFLGTEERLMLQSEALKCVWDYIKVNKLEDPMNTMMILCDSKLQELFGCEKFSSLGMSELLASHLFKQS